MPSRDDKTVGCKSLCMCMIREQRHIGAVALMGPAPSAPADGPAGPLPVEAAPARAFVAYCVPDPAAAAGVPGLACTEVDPSDA